jgi:hypothetical protein
MIRTIEFDDHEPCEYVNCKELAYCLVYSRSRQDIMKCCQEHAEKVVQEHHPEYVTFCDNCDCMLPIN